MTVPPASGLDAPQGKAPGRHAVVALLTDFGLKDVFVGLVKGVIAGINPEARVIDVTHALTPFEVVEAAFVLRATASYFPAGTVFCVVVDPGVGSSRRVLAARADERIFVAPDNGLLHPTLSRAAEAQVVSVENREYFLPRVSDTFHGRDIFAPVAAHLSLGLPLARLGRPAGRIEPLDLPEAILTPDGGVEGQVLLRDRFGNLITNIPAEMLDRLGPRERLCVEIAGCVICGLRRSYASAPPGDLLALVSSFDTLEIACNQHSAGDALGAERGDRVRVTVSG